MSENSQKFICLTERPLITVEYLRWILTSRPVRLDRTKLNGLHQTVEKCACWGRCSVLDVATILHISEAKKNKLTWISTRSYWWYFVHNNTWFDSQNKHVAFYFTKNSGLQNVVKVKNTGRLLKPFVCGKNNQCRLNRSVIWGGVLYSKIPSTHLRNGWDRHDPDSFVVLGNISSKQHAHCYAEYWQADYKFDFQELWEHAT